MKIQSLGYRTDIMFARFDGTITDHGEYVVVATPANPGFHWGNFLLFPRPPVPGDQDLWPNLFRKEFARDPLVKHIALGWDTTSPMRESELFVSQGFEAHTSVVLTSELPRMPEKFDREVSVRPLRTDSEWEAATQLQIDVREPIFKLENYSAFKRAQMARYRRMSEQGKGHWFGAYLGSRLVGDLGLYVEGPVGRFQNVGTHPDFRRRGICGRLVYEAAMLGLHVMGAKTLVMVADETYHAARIYEAAGFRPTERQAGVSLRPRADLSESGASPIFNVY
ncbi:MAG: GNAT family N-acetyltransferase [Deltaproteobacteria bacterium]|nr:GNAT family N-acetyltransferase [Deltaproteobacteria bacterium]